MGGPIRNVARAVLSGPDTVIRPLRSSTPYPERSKSAGRTNRPPFGATERIGYPAGRRAARDRDAWTWSTDKKREMHA